MILHANPSATHAINVPLDLSIMLAVAVVGLVSIVAATWAVDRARAWFITTYLD